jgi:hypothetical protein
MRNDDDECKSMTVNSASVIQQQQSALRDSTEQEADQAHLKRRKLESFMALARNAQNAQDQREHQQRRQLDEERKAWDEAIDQIRRNLSNESEFNR